MNTPCMVERSARQVRPQHIDHKGRSVGGGEQRDVGPLAHGHQGIGHGRTVGHHQHRGLQGHDAGHAAAVVVGVRAGEVGHLALADDLQPVGMDVVQVTHQVGTRPGGTHRHLVEPVEVQRDAEARGLQLRQRRREQVPRAGHRDQRQPEPAQHHRLHHGRVEPARDHAGGRHAQPGAGPAEDAKEQREQHAIE